MFYGFVEIFELCLRVRTYLGESLGYGGETVEILVDFVCDLLRYIGGYQILIPIHQRVYCGAMLMGSFLR